MPLQLTGRHMNISETHKAYINKKVDRLRRLCPKIDELSFTLTKEKLHFQADGTFRAGTLAAKASVEASQPLEAIDLLVDKLEHALSRKKAKRNDRHLVSRHKAKANEQILMEVPPDEEPEDAELPQAAEA